MAAAKRAHPILHRLRIAARRNFEVDRHGSAQRNLCGAKRHEAPFPTSAQGTEPGKVDGPLEVVMRVEMIALAKEKCIAGTVYDISQADFAIDGENAVPC